jgi:hypothetical protein
LAQAKAKEQRKHRPDAKDLRRRQLGDIAATLQGKSKKRKHDNAEHDEESPKSRASTGVDSDREDSTKRARVSRTGTLPRDDPRAGKPQDTVRDRSGDREKGRRRRHIEDEKPSSGEKGRTHRTRSRRDEDRSQSRSRPPAYRERTREHRHGHRSRHHDRSSSEEERAKRHRRSSHDRHRSSHTKTHRHDEKNTQNRDSNQRRRRSHKDDEPDTSDPLEEIVGPLPPTDQPVRPRGRGRGAGPSAMDSRFSDNYDPKAHVQLESEVEVDDDWDQALEALRDRQKWKQQGAERLRAAGFTEEQVKSWEKSEGKGGEKSIEDVQWAKPGEGREWDRGKVADAMDATLKARSSWKA